MKEETWQKLLKAGVSSQGPAKDPGFRIVLPIVAVPRILTLTLVQDLLERFAQEQKLPSALAYITWPEAINEFAPKLWYAYLEESGNVIRLRSDIRKIVLEAVSNEPITVRIHTYLIGRYWKSARYARVKKSDQLRYIVEILYHSVCAKQFNQAQLAQSITALITGEPLQKLIALLRQDEDLGQQTQIQDLITLLGG